MRKKGICLVQIYLFAEKKRGKESIAVIIVLFMPCSTHPTRLRNPDLSYPIPDRYAVFTVHCGLKLSKLEGHGSGG